MPLDNEQISQSFLQGEFFYSGRNLSVVSSICVVENSVALKVVTHPRFSEVGETSEGIGSQHLRHVVISENALVERESVSKTASRPRSSAPKQSFQSVVTRSILHGRSFAVAEHPSVVAPRTQTHLRFGQVGEVSAATSKRAKSHNAFGLGSEILRSSGLRVLVNLTAGAVAESFRSTSTRRVADVVVGSASLNNSIPQHKKNSILGLGALGAGYLGYWLVPFAPRQTVPGVDHHVHTAVGEISLGESTTATDAATFGKQAIAEGFMSSRGVERRSIRRFDAVSTSSVVESSKSASHLRSNSTSAKQSTEATKVRSKKASGAAAESAVVQSRRAVSRLRPSEVAEQQSVESIRSSNVPKFGSAADLGVVESPKFIGHSRLNAVFGHQSAEGTKTRSGRRSGVVVGNQHETSLGTSKYGVIGQVGEILSSTLTKKHAIRSISEIVQQFFGYGSYQFFVQYAMQELFIEKTAPGLYGEMKASTGRTFIESGTGSYKDGS